MATDDGASPRELLIESCRRNNTALLSTLFHPSDPTTTARFLNTTTDALGASALHLAAQYASYDVLDLLLDQEGVEIDVPEPRDGDTCLHRAVRFVAEAMARGDAEDAGRGKACVDILVDAGCDPRIRNKARLRPIDLADPKDGELRRTLQKAEMGMQLGDDVVVEDEEDGRRDGPGSESD